MHDLASSICASFGFDIRGKLASLNSVISKRFIQVKHPRNKDIETSKKKNTFFLRGNIK